MIIENIRFYGTKYAISYTSYSCAVGVWGVIQEKKLQNLVGILSTQKKILLKE